MTDERDRPPVALVTGTSSGIGMHTAVGLARRGWTVVATVRDTSSPGTLLEHAAAAGVRVRLAALDVTDAEQARTCVHAVVTEHGGLDVLVNNAGRGNVGTLEQLDDAALQQQLDVNYLAVARLTRLAMPALRAGTAAGRRGRVVTVTSVGGVVGQPFADAYCGAKFATEGLMQSLAPVAARVGVDVCVVEPAAVASDFVANLGATATPADVVDDAGPLDPYAGLRAAYLRRSAAGFARAQPAVEAAAVVVEAATTPQHRFRWQTSAGASSFAGLSLLDLDGGRVIGTTGTWLD